MTRSEIAARLHLWGRVYGQRRGEPPEDRSPTGNSPLAAFGRSNGYEPVGRSGVSRREMMGAAAGVRRVPLDYVDPIPCCASRGGKAPDYDPRVTQEVERVQAAWMALKRASPDLAEVVRVEFHLPGTQREKAGQQALTYKQFRIRLETGIARVAAAI